MKNSSFFVFKATRFFLIIEQAKLNRAVFQETASQAEPSFFVQKLEPKPSRALAQTQH